MLEQEDPPAQVVGLEQTLRSLTGALLRATGHANAQVVCDTDVDAHELPERHLSVTGRSGDVAYVVVTHNGDIYGLYDPTHGGLATLERHYMRDVFEPLAPRATLYSAPDAFFFVARSDGDWHVPKDMQGTSEFLRVYPFADAKNVKIGHTVPGPLLNSEDGVVVMHHRMIAFRVTLEVEVPGKTAEHMPEPRWVPEADFFSPGAMPMRGRFILPTSLQGVGDEADKLEGLRRAAVARVLTLRLF